MLAITFGLFSSVCLIISSLSLSRKRILILGLFINLFQGIQYMILGQSGALVLIGLGFLMTATVLASLRWKALGTAKVLTGFLLAYPLAFFGTSGGVQEWPELLPLFSTMIATTAVFMRNLMVIKGMFILNGLSWLTFEMFAGAYGSMPGEILTVTGNITSFIMLARAYASGIALESVPELNVRIAALMKSARGRRNLTEVITETENRELVTAYILA